MNRPATLTLSAALTASLLAGCAPQEPTYTSADYDAPQQAVELCVNQETGEALPADQQKVCDDDYRGPYPSGFSATDFLLGYVVASALSPAPYGQRVDYTRTPPTKYPKVDHRKHQAGLQKAQQKRDQWVTQQKAKPAQQAPKPAAPKPAQNNQQKAPAVKAPAPAVKAPAPAPVRVAPAPRAR